MKYKFSIIVPFQVSSPSLIKLMNSLDTQYFKDFELILIPDNKFYIDLSNFSFPVNVIYNDSLPSKKRNLAAKISKGEYLVFIDDDAFPEKLWLYNANQILNKNKYISIGGPGIAPTKLNFFQKSVIFFLTNRFLNLYGNRYSSNFKKKKVTDWPSVNLFVKKTIFSKIGGFDINFWPGEDSILCNEINKYGEIIYEPSLIVYHSPRENLFKFSKQIYRYGFHRAILMKDRKINLNIGPFLPLLNFFVMIVLSILSYLISMKIILIYFFMAVIYIFISVIFTSFIEKIKIRYSFMVIPILILTHLFYSLGLLSGLLKKHTISNKGR